VGGEGEIGPPERYPKTWGLVKRERRKAGAVWGKANIGGNGLER